MADKSVKDNDGLTWRVAEASSRGTWGSTYDVVATDGRTGTLKIPLSSADFPEDAPPPGDVVDACRQHAALLAQAMTEGKVGYLPRIHSVVDGEDGSAGLLLPRYATLAQRLTEGLSLEEAFELVGRIAQRLGPQSHGNLRPTNVFFGESGALYLADPLTPALADAYPFLAETGGAQRWLPPEASSRTDSGRHDSWFLAQLLWAASCPLPSGLKPAGAITPTTALDKLDVSDARSQFLAQIEAHSNPRFRVRAADEFGRLLGRALSADAAPSPPFRFGSARAFAKRSQGVRVLLQPRVTRVSEPRLESTTGIFDHGEPIRVAVTVTCTEGLLDPNDVAFGMRVIDRDAAADALLDIEHASFDVHDYGGSRMRYTVSFEGPPAGRYRLSLGFSVCDSGDAPVEVDADFDVHARPGHVPSSDVSAPQALPFAPRATANPVPPSDAGVSPDEEPATATEVVDPQSEVAFDLESPMPLPPVDGPRPPLPRAPEQPRFDAFSHPTNHAPQPESVAPESHAREVASDEAAMPTAWESFATRLREDTPLALATAVGASVLLVLAILVLAQSC